MEKETPNRTEHPRAVGQYQSLIYVQLASQAREGGREERRERKSERKRKQKRQSGEGRRREGDRGRKWDRRKFEEIMAKK